jgi:hypothetical protein
MFTRRVVTWPSRTCEQRRPLSLSPACGGLCALRARAALLRRQPGSCRALSLALRSERRAQEESAWDVGGVSNLQIRGCLRYYRCCCQPLRADCPGNRGVQRRCVDSYSAHARAPQYLQANRAAWTLLLSQTSMSDLRHSFASSRPSFCYCLPGSIACTSDAEPVRRSAERTSLTRANTTRANEADAKRLDRDRWHSDCRSRPGRGAERAGSARL